jgi:hypothetical protein
MVYVYNHVSNDLIERVRLLKFIDFVLSNTISVDLALYKTNDVLNFTVAKTYDPAEAYTYANIVSRVGIFGYRFECIVFYYNGK